MDKFFLLLPTFLLFLFGCSPTPEKASEYNNRLIRQQRAVISKIDNLISSFNTHNPKEMNQAYEELLSSIDKAIDTVSQMKDFYGDSTFKSQTLKLLKVYKQVTENEFRTILNLLSKPESQYSTQDAKQVSEAMYNAKIKINSANKAYKEYQKQFAQKYNLSLVD